MELDKEAISQRLREFGINKFKSIKAFAKALEMSPPALQTSYLSGRSLPGAPKLALLIMYGCDIGWLFWGDETEYRDQINSELRSELNDVRTEYKELIKKQKQLKDLIK